MAEERYIDSISPSLQMFNDSMGGLQRMKQSAISQRLQLADMLNRQGDNQAAEDALDSARNYGLSSLFSKPPTAFSVQGAYSNQNTPDVALQPLQDLQAKQQVYGGVDAAQGGILAQLQQVYGGKTPDYYNQLKVMGLQAAGADPQSALSAALDTNKIVNNDIRSNIDPVFNAQLQDYKNLQSDQAYSDKQTDKANAPIIQANNAANAYNQKAQAYNDNRPQYHDTYDGDMVDQRQQLMDDTNNAIHDALQRGDQQAALSAYNKYRVTDASILAHYQQKPDPLDAAYFFPKPTVGGGGKLRDVDIKGSDGQTYTVQVSKDAPVTSQADSINKQLITLGGKNPNGNYVTWAGGGVDPRGDVSGDLTNINMDILKKQQEADQKAKETALLAWNQADVPNSINYFNKDKRAAIANASLPSNNPYYFNADGTMSYKNNVAQSQNQNNPPVIKSGLWQPKQGNK